MAVDISILCVQPIRKQKESGLRIKLNFVSRTELGCVLNNLASYMKIIPNIIENGSIGSSSKIMLKMQFIW